MRQVPPSPARIRPRRAGPADNLLGGLRAPAIELEGAWTPPGLPSCARCDTHPGAAVAPLDNPGQIQGRSKSRQVFSERRTMTSSAGRRFSLAISSATRLTSHGPDASPSNSPW